MNRHRIQIAFPALALLLLTACVGPEPGKEPDPPVVRVPVDRSPALAAADLPAYRRVRGVGGTLTAVGSDTLNNLMTLWGEGFQREYPNVRIQIEGKGSSTAPPALIKGTAQLGPMSRPMKATERDAFEARFGYKPQAIRVAIDALAVYVHKDNPIESLTVPQLDAMFSSTRRCGAVRAARTWGDVGLRDGWAERPIGLYGRNSASGTNGYFKTAALCKGDFLDRVKEQPGSASVVQGVSEDLGAIGYSGIGYRTSGVRPIPLARAAGDAPVPVDEERVVTGEYPLSRFLYIYINRPPGQPLEGATGEFLRYVLSRSGQEVVTKDGYLPITARIAAEERSALE